TIFGGRCSLALWRSSEGFQPFCLAALSAASAESVPTEITRYLPSNLMTGRKFGGPIFSGESLGVCRMNAAVSGEAVAEPELSMAWNLGAGVLVPRLRVPPRWPPDAP